MPERFQNPKWNTFIIPILRTDLIERCLETLYRYTERSSFYIYILDQSIEGLDATKLRNQYENCMVIRTPKTDIHRTGNLGHSQASNLGLSLVQTPYATLLNDDVEFISTKWWQGILDTFESVKKATPDRPAMLVNAASIKLPDWSVGREHGDDFYILPYKENYTDEDWDFLVNKEHYVNDHLTLLPGSVIDGINLYCSVIDMELLHKVGFIDERYYPGNANDYDFSCRVGMRGYRCVGTTLSWVFHHWSSTFHAKEEYDKLVQPELIDGDLRNKWGDRLDIWGVKAPCGEVYRTLDNKKAVCPKHPDEIYYIPPNTDMPL